MSVLPEAGIWLVAYMALRIVGRFLGGWIGGSAPVADPPVRRWMGMALLPQAGVVLGMALVAGQQFPEVGEAILPVVVAATVLFELIGPIATRVALRATDGS
jgi:Kef-type K+ transport system membrane component KefB